MVAAALWLSAAGCAKGGAEAGSPAGRGADRERMWELARQLGEWSRDARLVTRDVVWRRSPGPVCAEVDATIRVAGAMSARRPGQECAYACVLASQSCRLAAELCELAARLGPDPWGEDKCRDARGFCLDVGHTCCACIGRPVAETVRPLIL